MNKAASGVPLISPRHQSQHISQHSAIYLNSVAAPAKQYCPFLDPDEHYRVQEEAIESWTWQVGDITINASLPQLGPEPPPRPTTEPKTLIQ